MVGLSGSCGIGIGFSYVFQWYAVLTVSFWIPVIMKPPKVHAEDW